MTTNMRLFTRLTIENGYYVGKEVVIQITKNDMYDHRVTCESRYINIKFYYFQRFICLRFLGTLKNWHFNEFRLLSIYT